MGLRTGAGSDLSKGLRPKCLAWLVGCQDGLGSHFRQAVLASNRRPQVTGIRHAIAARSARRANLWSNLDLLSWGSLFVAAAHRLRFRHGCIKLVSGNVGRGMRVFFMRDFLKRLDVWSGVAETSS
jgi:hypothetical protein